MASESFGPEDGWQSPTDPTLWVFRSPDYRGVSTWYICDTRNDSVVTDLAMFGYGHATPAEAYAAMERHSVGRRAVATECACGHEGDVHVGAGCGQCPCRDFEAKGAGLQLGGVR